MRTLIIWAYDLATGGGSFHWLQVAGFGLMLTGTLIYNGAVKLPCFRSDEGKSDDAERHEQLKSLRIELLAEDFISPALSRYNLKTSY